MDKETSSMYRERDTRAFEELLDFAVEAQGRVERLSFQALGFSASAGIIIFSLSISFLPTIIDIFSFGDVFTRIGPTIALYALLISFLSGSFVYFYFYKLILREKRALAEIREVIDEVYTLLSDGLSPVERARARVIMSRL